MRRRFRTKIWVSDIIPKNTHIGLVVPNNMKVSVSYLRLIFVALLLIVVSMTGEFRETAAKSQVAQTLRPPMFVLQVGIGKYLNAPTWSDLRGAVTDVVELRKLLEGERFQVASANIVTLTNEQGTKSKIFTAFHEHLIAKAKDHFEKTKRRDAVVLFQYSGHGSQAPDADKDEEDKLDETLVTYDSQDVKGKNFDVTDDEIFALTAELKKYTDNIVYIIDSCHSGSGTRNAEDARRLPARTTVPEPVAIASFQTRSGGEKATDKSDGGVMPPGDDYIVISAAQAEQLATQKYCFEECGSDKEPVVYGLLTYHLIDELKNARSDTTYREVMENVVRKVSADRPTQTPLIEGDQRRAVFGSLGKAEDNFVPILSVEANSVRIRSGAIQGVAVGSIVSFYDKAVKRFDEAEKIATGRVSHVTATESDVRLVDSKRLLTISDKAIIASPDLGSTRLKVLLAAAEQKSDAAQDINTRLRTAFEPKAGNPDPSGVDILADTAPNRQTGRWNVAVLKDRFSKVFLKAARGEAAAPKCANAGSDDKSPEREIYYIAGADYVPLFNFCVEARGDASKAASEIERGLTHIARYRAVQSVRNKRSRLAGKVTVKPIRLFKNRDDVVPSTHCVDGKIVSNENQPILPSANGKYQFRPREVFWFEVTNNSPFNLYVAMLNLKPDGSVKLNYPRNLADEKNGVTIPKNGGKRILTSDRCRLNDDRTNFAEVGMLIISSGYATDAFKFIATVNRMGWDDLSYLEMEGIRRNQNASLATNNEWIAIDLTFEIKN